jgi:hypothetical protein
MTKQAITFKVLHYGRLRQRDNPYHRRWTSHKKWQCSCGATGKEYEAHSVSDARLVTLWEEHLKRKHPEYTTEAEVV